MKIPHLDFGSRTTITGEEEIYTQNQNFDPKEQKFTVDVLKKYLLGAIVAKNAGNKGYGVYASNANGILLFKNRY